MKKFMVLISALCVLPAVQAGVTTHLKLDCRMGVRQCSASGETLRYDANWYENGKRVRITDNGKLLTTGVSGTYTWYPDSASTFHLLVLEYLHNGVVVSSETAQFAYSDAQWEYTVSDGEARIDGFSGVLVGELVIPSVIDGYPVTCIGCEAFRDCSGLTSVTIPSGVTRIHGGAFVGCSGLTSMTIPSGVWEIGECAFSGCEKLKEFVVASGNANYKSVNGLLLTKDGECLVAGVNGDVVIPSSVTSIGESAFEGYGGLTSVTIPSSVRSIFDSAFCDCNGLMSVSIPLNVEWIGDYAFYGCSGLTSVTIPSIVTSIGDFTFYGCSGLTSVTIPSSVEYIGDYAFEDCPNLTTVYVSPDDALRVANLYDWSEDVTFCEKGASTYHTVIDPNTGIVWSFQEIDGEARGLHPNISMQLIGAVTIPSFLDGYPVISLLDSAFWGGTEMTKVTIPASLTSIGTGAFRRCGKLKEFVVASGNANYKSVNGLLLTKDGKTLVAGVNGDVVIPSSVTSIGDYAFWDYSGLTSVTIPSSVTSIGVDAFSGCGKLKEFVVASGNSEYKSCDGLLLTKDGKTLIAGVNGDVVIPSCVKIIDIGAFSGRSGLTSVTIPSSVTSIAEYAFQDCGGMLEFVVAASNTKYRSKNGLLLTKDGETLVAGVNGNVVIPSGVTSIGDYAFSGCSGLMSVTIPSGVTSIGDSAFYGCSGLTDVMLPSSVTSIGFDAFCSCDGLTSMTIPSGVEEIGEQAFANCAGLTSVTISSGVTTIGDYAFLLCPVLTTVVIPPSVTSIGYGAFMGCGGESTVTVYVDDGDVARVQKMYDWDENVVFVEGRPRIEYNVELWVPNAKQPLATLACRPGKVYKLPACTAAAPAGKRFAGWRCSNGRRYDDGMLVFDLGEVGTTLTLTAIWE